jgi:diguanylate cyclase (GGDEF)-like protein
LRRIQNLQTDEYVFRIIDGDSHGHRSTNGLIINGRRCFQYDLKDGDYIRFCDNINARFFAIKNLDDLKASRFSKMKQGIHSIISHENSSDSNLVSSQQIDAISSEFSANKLTDFPIIDVDLAGKVVYYNAAAQEVFPGLEQGKVEPTLVENLSSYSQDAIARKNTRKIQTSTKTFEQSSLFLSDLGLIRNYFLDITRLREADLKLHQAMLENQVQLNFLPDLMILLNSEGIILDLKPVNEMSLLTAFSKAKPQQHISEVLPISVTQQMMHYLRQVLYAGKTQTFDCEIHFNRESIYCEIRITRTFENRAIVIIRNISNRKFIEKRLLHEALHDSLTGLPNRNLFLQRVTYAIKLAQRRKNYLFAIFFIDLDRFKVINDSLGHVVGDQLLVAIAHKIESCIRVKDTIARFGGDEFAILLENLKSMDEAIQVAKRLQEQLLLPVHLDKHEVFTNVSIGIASSEIGYSCPEDILRDADTAMYHAKSRGRGRYEIFDKTMHARAVMLMRLDNDLRRAVERQEFRLFYQPIVDLQTGTIAGVEALIRWFHPHRGLVPPNEFIQLAEETGLILPIGEWLLSEACRQFSEWQQHIPHTSAMTINVNLSCKQFTHPRLVQQIQQVLHQNHLQPQVLKLEITESTIMENSQRATDTLAELKELGIQLCIDDFGTGYSSLSYLHRFPIDSLKVDRSFIKAIDTNDETSGIVITNTIVMLAQHLGISLVAEGIETAKQLSFLRTLKCEYGQGYYFAKPLDSEGIEALLISNPKW